MSNFTFGAQPIYQAMGAGLDTWVSWARGIRIMSRNGQQYLPLGTGSNLIDTSKLVNYYMGAAVIAGIFLLVFIFTFLGCCCELCCLCCCRKSIRRKNANRKPITRAKRICAIIWYVLIFLAFLVGAGTSFSSGSIFTNSVTTMRNGTLGAINGTNTVLKSFSPAISEAFDSIVTMINGVVDTSVNSIVFADVDATGLRPNLRSLSSGMRTVANNRASILSTGTSVVNTKSSLTSKFTDLSTAITGVDTEMTKWTTSGQLQVPANPSITYTYTGSLTSRGSVLTSISSASSSMSNAPDGSSNLNSLRNGPDLAAYADSIDNILTQLETSLTSNLLAGGRSVKSSAIPAINSAKSSATSAIDKAQGPLSNTLDNLYTQLGGIFDSVTSYDGNRGIAMIILSCWILLIVIFMCVAMYRNKPNQIKGCNLCSSPIYLLIQLFAFILFLVALVFGDVCGVLFETQPSPLGVALQTQYLDYLFTVRQNCSNGISILKIVTNMGFIDAQSINLTKLASDQINTLNFSSVTSFDLSSSISLSNSPTSQLSSLTSIDLSTLNTTNIDTLRQTTLPNLVTALTTLRTSLNSLYSSVATGDIALSSGTANSDLTSALSDLKTRIQRQVTILDNAINSGNSATYNIPSMISTLDTLSDTVNVLKNTTIPNAVSLANTLPSYYGNASTALGVFSSHAQTNISGIVPNIKSTILTTLPTIENRLYNRTTCEELGKSLYTIQDAVCGQLEGALDGMWLAYGILGIFAFISMPALIWATNRLWAQHYQKVTPVDVASGFKSPKPRSTKLETNQPQPKKSFYDVLPSNNSKKSVKVSVVI
ncbi:hypothetical protein EDD86DRAFT_240622 [Gorgonomyces haynaldii]|nr:hypothetical protein EDD86DRAFT_240622 [Gorgonomyces haynaldii]